MKINLKITLLLVYISIEIQSLDVKQTFLNRLKSTEKLIKDKEFVNISVNEIPNDVKEMGIFGIHLKYNESYHESYNISNAKFKSELEDINDIESEYIFDITFNVSTTEEVTYRVLIKKDNQNVPCFKESHKVDKETQIPIQEQEITKVKSASLNISMEDIRSFIDQLEGFKNITLGEIQQNIIDFAKDNAQLLIQHQGLIYQGIRDAYEELLSGKMYRLLLRFSAQKPESTQIHEHLVQVTIYVKLNGGYQLISTENVY